jgi:hypothetical protein
MDSDAIDSLLKSVKKYVTLGFSVFAVFWVFCFLLGVAMCGLILWLLWRLVHHL